jgi:adenylyltransferase/sulfurtransferase
MLDSRYARQLALRGFGPVAQDKLAASRVLIVGVGGLGSPAAMYLAAAGVGELTLVDADLVDRTNLHRQLLYTTPDVGRPKLEVAHERLQAINPLVAVHRHEGRLTAQNAESLVAGHDIVIDATDNFPARYALNDACLALGVPFVYASVARFEGQLSVFAASGGPCYRCLFPEMPAPGSVPTCAEEGVLGVVPGILGLQQATEAIKWITGIGTPLVGTLLLLDFLEQDTQRIQVARRDGCSACGVPRTAARTAPSPSRPTSMPVQQLSPSEVAARLASDTPPVILDVREQWEYDLAHLADSTLIPLNTIPTQGKALDPSLEYAVLCHHGMRSEMAANWLAQNGFSRLINIDGGIDAWSLEVDASVPRY